MDKKLRQVVEHDKFREEVVHTVEYLGAHRAAVKKYGAVAVGALVIAGVVWGYMSYQRNTRQEALRKAAVITDAFVGDQSPTGGLAFKTQGEKDAAAQKAYAEAAARYSGTKEGLIARFHAATLLCDQSKLPECEAGFKEVAAGSDVHMQALGKHALAMLYVAQDRVNDAEPLLRQLAASPSAMISKEEAQLTLADALARTKPQEARMIVESLKDIDRPAVSRRAVAILGKLTGQQ